MNDALQGDNLDDDLRARLGLQPGQQTGAAGNPIDISLRLELDARRPDRARQGVVLRRHPLVAARPVPDRRVQSRRLAGHRRQPHSQLHRQGHLAGDGSVAQGVVPAQQEHQRSLPSPQRAVSDRRGQGDGAAGPAGAELRLAQYNQVLGSRGMVSTRASAACGASSRSATRRRCGPPTSAIRDVRCASRASTAVETQSAQPQRSLPGPSPPATFSQGARTGTHDFKAGVQFSRERVQYERIRNGDYFLELHDGAPFQAAAVEHADQLGPSPEHVGRLPAGSLDGRARHDQRRRAHRRRERATCRRRPARPAPSSGSAASRRPTVFDFGPNVAPRLGVVVRPVRQRPDGAQGVLRPLLQSVRLADRRSRQPERDRQPGGDAGPTPTATVALDPGELGTFTGFPRGLFPTVDGDATPSVQRGVQRRRRAAARPQHGAVGAATTAAITATGSASSIAPAAPEAYTPVAAHLRRPDQRPDAVDHHLQPAAGVHHRARPLHQQRRVPRAATTTACSSTSRSGCRIAGRCWPA